MDGFPADPSDRGAAIALNPMPHPGDSHQPLHVDVEELAGSALLMADRAPLRLELR
jgi:hypothetical protein